MPTEKKGRLLVVDGHNLLFQMFFGMPARIHNREGRAVQGVIKPIAKPRGEQKSLDTMYARMRELGYCGGKLRISYCEKESVAAGLAARVRADFPEADIDIYPARALCSFYAERGGIIAGFETNAE